MTANSLDILGDAFGVVIEGVPVDVVTGDGAAAVLRIGPGLAVELRGFKVVFQQIPDDLPGKQLHSAIAVVHDEPFLGVEQLMRNNQRANGIVRCSAARIADDVGVAFGQAGVFCGIEPRSMQVRMAKRRAGGSASFPLSPKFFA